jgi:hypothetical protein
MKSLTPTVALMFLTGCRTPAPQLLPLPKPVPEPKAIAAPTTPAPTVAPIINPAAEQRLKQQRQMIEALMSQNDALTAKFNAPVLAPAPVPASISPKPVTAVESPRATVTEPTPPLAPLPVPPAVVVAFVTPNTDGVIDLTVVSTSPNEPVNPFAVRHLPPEATHEIALQINGIIGGSTPSVLVNGRVIQPGEAVESLTLERCEPDAAIFRRGEHLLRLPISTQAIRVRLAL